MGKHDYFAVLDIAAQELDESKNPPICDSCNNPLENKLDVFKVYCLILGDANGNENFWGVLCPTCIEKYHAKLVQIEERYCRPVVRMVCRSTLSRPISVFGVDVH